jgi:hypothetical protein
MISAQGSFLRHKHARGETAYFQAQDVILQNITKNDATLL